MSKMNWERPKLDTKRALVHAAARELPQTITANLAGTCTECGGAIIPGRAIQKSATGWKHALCTGKRGRRLPSADEIVHERMRQRRATLASRRTTTN